MMKLVMTCGWCGKREERMVIPQARIELPDGWVTRPTSPVAGFLLAGLEDERVFCSQECRLNRIDTEKDIAKKAQREGERVARELFQRELRAELHRARGAVIALAEIVEDEP